MYGQTGTTESAFLFARNLIFFVKQLTHNSKNLSIERVLSMRANKNITTVSCLPPPYAA